MKPRGYFMAGLLLALVMVGSSCSTLTVCPARPPSASDVLGTWFGYSTDQLEFLRLELRSNGTGLLGVSYLPDSSPALYTVDTWRLKDWCLELVVSPTTTNSEPIAVRQVRYDVQSLGFEFGGINLNWKRAATLFREKDFLLRDRQLKDEIEQYEKAGHGADN